MAEKAKWQSFYSVNPTYSGMGGIGLNNSRKVEGVWDQYSNVYYGEARTKDQFLSPLKTDLAALNEYITSKGSGYTFSPIMGGQDKLSNIQSILGINPNPIGYTQPNSKDLMTLAQEKYLELNNQYEKINAADYKYQDQMQASVNQYGKGWGDYFEASYRNPRMAEEQRQSALTKTDQYKAQVEEANNKAQLTSANQLEIQAPRQVGTGVGTGRDTSINQLLSNGGTGLGL